MSGRSPRPRWRGLIIGWRAGVKRIFVGDWRGLVLDVACCGVPPRGRCSWPHEQLRARTGFDAREPYAQRFQLCNHPPERIFSWRGPTIAIEGKETMEERCHLSWNLW